jgi:hypothetical protein
MNFEVCDKRASLEYCQICEGFCVAELVVGQMSRGLISNTRQREIFFHNTAIRTFLALRISSLLQRLVETVFCLSSVVLNHVRWVPLSPQYGASSGCGWKGRPPALEVSCEYIE